MPLILKNRVSAHASTNPSNMSPMARTTRVRTCATIALYQDMQLTAPRVPAIAVSTAISSLSISFQFFIFVIYYLRFTIYY